ncbi:MAG TPA: MraY family glycosyltransferase [Pirellulales bacterium]|nr:MraY family glycosyltransferase [Pirellulales bacterium]
MTTLLAIIAVAFMSSVVATLVMRTVAHRVGLTDRPDAHRKMQSKPVALGGGVAVFVGLLVALAMVAATPNHFRGQFLAGAGNLCWLLVAGMVIVLVGLLDDRCNLRGRHKLLGQIAAALILVPAGFAIHHVRIFDTNIELGLLSVPFTLFWLLGAVNALNLIDGADGLASSVGIILCLAISGMCLLTRHPVEGIVAWAFAGSLLGFLCFNFPPARIYLGDAGSMLIGLLVGALAIRASLKGPATVALAAPLAIWAIPIFDVSAAIVRRKLTGRSVYTTDRGHLHHRLLAMTGNNTLVLGVVAAACVITCLGATLSLHFNNDLLAFAAVAPVAGIFVVTRAFGDVELLLVANRVKSLGQSMLNPVSGRSEATVEAAVRLQGDRPWDELWASLTEFADKLRLYSIRLDVNLPAVREDFHASWRRPSRCDPQELWRTEIPLFLKTNVIGRLVVAGKRDDGPSCQYIERLMDLLEPFETQLVEMAAANTRPVELETAELDLLRLSDTERLPALGNTSKGGV